MILDLSLPERDGERGEKPQRGMDVLRHAQRRMQDQHGGPERETAVHFVLTFFCHFDFVRDAFRLGVVDFLAKPVNPLISAIIPGGRCRGQQRVQINWRHRGARH